MTLVEVTIAMGLVVLLCAGLYAVGLKARLFAEHNRLATEARSLGKERMEDMISLGAENLAKSGCTLLNTDTNKSSTNCEIVRRPQVIWHAADGTVAAADAAAYGEVHVDVVYRSPLINRLMTNTYALIVKK